MKITNKASILLVTALFGCATTRVQTQVSHPQTEVEPLQTPIDLSVYSPPPVPSAVHSLDIGTYHYPPTSGAAIARITEGATYRVAFTGVCVNGPAQAAITSEVSANILNAENEARTRVANLGAQALRDIAIARSDTNVQRAYYQAQINTRDEQISISNRLLQTYERNSGLTVWQGIGWGALGVFAGIAATGVYLLITH
jgi:hypothetical protein